MCGIALGVGEEADWAEAIFAAGEAACVHALIAPHTLIHTTAAATIVLFPIFIPVSPTSHQQREF